MCERELLETKGGLGRVRRKLTPLATQGLALALHFQNPEPQERLVLLSNPKINSFSHFIYRSTYDRRVSVF